MRVEEIGRVHQWDAERRVRALGAPAGAAVAMANDGDAQGWSVPVEADGTAPIPPELLQSGKDVTCWLTVGGNVVATDRVPVVRRAKPADYAYAPTDAKRVEDLRALLEGLTAQAKGAAERWPALEDAAKAATAAANQAAKEVAASRLVGEVSGAVAHADDAYSATALGLTVYGASAQDGTPTPAAPKPITSVTSAELRISGADTAVFDALPLDLRGHELCSLPNGVRDELRIDERGDVELVKRTWRLRKRIGDMDNNEDFPGWKIPRTEMAPPVSDGVDIIALSWRNSHFPNFCINSQKPPSEWMLYTYGHGYTQSELIAQYPDEVVTFIGELAAPMIIPLGKVAMPTLPAPVANACVASDVPTECAARYVRDANIVIGRLEKKLATVAAAAI